METKDLKVDGVYFFNWKSFIIVTSITKDFIKYKSININLSTGEEKISIKREEMDTEVFKDRLLSPLKTYKEAKQYRKGFEKNIIFFLFKLSN